MVTGPKSSSFDQAYDLRTVEGLHSWDGLTIDPSEDDDWFRFTTLGQGQYDHHVSIDFLHSLGDIDLELFNANGDLLGSSTSVSNSESISLDSLVAGTYYIRAYGFNGVTNPNYSLSIFAPTQATGDWAEENDTLSEAYNLRELPPFQQGWDDLNIDQPHDDDWFRFQLLGDANDQHFVKLDYLQSLGQLELSLHGQTDL